MGGTGGGTEDMITEGDRKLRKIRSNRSYLDCLAWALIAENRAGYDSCSQKSTNLDLDTWRVHVGGG